MTLSNVQQAAKAASENHQSSEHCTSHPTLLPGIRCPTCQDSGKEVWVLPGKECGYCGTPCG